MKPEQIREQITKTIIETLEKGDVPFWKRGWSDDPNALGMAKSLSTGNYYRGTNGCQTFGLKMCRYQCSEESGFSTHCGYTDFC